MITGVKCEIARFLRHRERPLQNRPNFFTLDETQIAEVELTLKTTKRSEGSLKGATVLAFAGGSIAPWLSASVSESETITGTTQFVIEQKLKGDPVSCPEARPNQPAFGLADWLLKKFATERDIKAGAPHVGLGKIIISTDFAVTRGVQGGLQAQFIPVTAAPAAAAAREDIQSLKIVLRGYHVQQRFEAAKGGPERKTMPMTAPMRVPAIN